MPEENRERRGRGRMVLHLSGRQVSQRQRSRDRDAFRSAYGGDFEPHHVRQNLLITSKDFRSLGLHKPTLFRLDLGNRKRLPWCEEYFVTQGYVVPKI